jgi:UDP-N-acetylmuramate--alanine ligase
MKPALHRITRLHFTGIGGVGMGALAELLHRQGVQVSGSDRIAGSGTGRLQALGVEVSIGHDPLRAAAAQALVVSSAVPADDPERVAAIAAGRPIVPRGLLLAALMQPHCGVAIAGAHGKTTTTALVAAVLQAGGLDPTVAAGGTLHALGSPARLGHGEVFVAEADESDASFLHLQPVLGVVTNIDSDHMETYGHDPARLQQAYADFLARLPFHGCAIVCADDPGVQALLPRLPRPPQPAARLLRYGLADDADIRARAVEALPGGGMRFVAVRGAARTDLLIELPLAGRHNVLNALAAIAVAQEFDVPDEAVQQALRGFAGVGRRFERHGPFVAAGGGRFALIDDYGHHPAEMAAVLAAARAAWPGRRLLLAFQPHRYTRTRDCFDDFVAVLAQADAVLLVPVYAAGEAPIAGCDHAALGAALSRAVARVVATRAAAPVVTVLDTLDALAPALVAAAHDGDLVLSLGAGSIAALPAQLQALAAAPGDAATPVPLAVESRA